MKIAPFFSLFFLSVSFNMYAGSSTSFCVLCDIPYALSTSNLNATSATLSWQAVNGSTQYIIEVQDFLVTPNVFLIDTVEGTTFVVNGLHIGTTYKFKVSAQCGSEYSMWSEWRLFTTSSVITTDSTCAAPTLLASKVKGSTAQLSWNNVGDENMYFLDVVDEDEQGMQGDFQLSLSVSDSFYNMTDLEEGILYKFRIGKPCNDGQDFWSNWQYFNGNMDSISVNGGATVGCIKPIGLQALGITSNAAELSWYPSPGAVSYIIEVQLFETGNESWQMTQVVDANNFHLKGLSEDTRYKYRVRSNCSSGANSAWSKWMKFQTATFVLIAVEGQIIDSLEGAEEEVAFREGNSTADASGFRLNAWPNPVKTTATIQLQHLNTEPVTLRVMDIDGHPVLEQHFKPEGDIWEGTLSFQDLPDGMYLMQTQNGSNTNITKLVVMH